MSVIIPGLSTSQKTPGVYLNVILGGPGTSAGAAPESILLIGNKLEVAISDSAPTIDVADGTMPLATPTFCASVDDALTLCGQGSELHRMARAVFAQYPAANLFLAANAVSAGSAATAGSTGSGFSTSGSAGLGVSTAGVPRRNRANQPFFSPSLMRRAVRSASRCRPR